MMKINIYSNYEVSIKIRDCYIDEEDSEPNDIVYKRNNFETKTDMNGGELIDFLQDKLNEDYISEIEFKKNDIFINYFIPMTGESTEYLISIKQVDKE